jgi:hypothetical protein
MTHAAGYWVGGMAALVSAIPATFHPARPTTTLPIRVSPSPRPVRHVLQHHLGRQRGLAAHETARQGLTHAVQATDDPRLGEAHPDEVGPRQRVAPGMESEHSQALLFMFDQIEPAIGVGCANGSNDERLIGPLRQRHLSVGEVRRSAGFTCCDLVLLVQGLASPSSSFASSLLRRG